MRRILLYTPPNGEIPFLRFMTDQDSKLRRKIERAMKCLILYPLQMSEPVVKHFTIERYKEFYELREKSRVMARIIFTIADNGDLIMLHPFIKKQNRNTMQALELSVKMLDEIRLCPQNSLAEYKFSKHEEEKMQ